MPGCLSEPLSLMFEQFEGAFGIMYSAYQRFRALLQFETYASPVGHFRTRVSIY